MLHSVASCLYLHNLLKSVSQLLGLIQHLIAYGMCCTRSACASEYLVSSEVKDLILVSAVSAYVIGHFFFLSQILYRLYITHINGVQCVFKGFLCHI